MRITYASLRHFTAYSSLRTLYRLLKFTSILPVMQVYVHFTAYTLYSKKCVLPAQVYVHFTAYATFTCTLPPTQVYVHFTAYTSLRPFYRTCKFMSFCRLGKFTCTLPLTQCTSILPHMQVSPFYRLCKFTVHFTAYASLLALYRQLKFTSILPPSTMPKKCVLSIQVYVQFTAYALRPKKCVLSVKFTSIFPSMPYTLRNLYCLSSLRSSALLSPSLSNKYLLSVKVRIPYCFVNVYPLMSKKSVLHS